MGIRRRRGICHVSFRLCSICFLLPLFYLKRCAEKVRLVFVLGVNNSWEKNNGIYWCVKNYRKATKLLVRTISYNCHQYLYWLGFSLWVQQEVPPNPHPQKADQKSPERCELRDTSWITDMLQPIKSELGSLSSQPTFNFLGC